MITAPMVDTRTSTKAFSRSTRYSIPHGGAQPPRWYEIGPAVNTCHSIAPAMTGIIQLTTSATANAVAPRRMKPVSRAPISGMTT